MSFSNYLENALLDHTFGNTAFTQPSTWYVKLHIGDPGEAGTGNPAAETTRKQETDWTAASGGSVSNTTALSWTNYPATEDVSHISVWDHATAGNCLGSGALSATKSMTGPGTDTLTIPAGDLDITLD